MRYPQVVVCAFDDWTANQLRPQAAEHRWLLRSVRQAAAARDLALALEPRPTVLLVQADPAADKPDALRLVADVHRLRPDVAVVVLSDVKLGEDERATWAAGVYDLGARFVLVPPLTRPVLEDLVGGLMAATVRRVVGGGPEPTPASEVIDLAEGGYEDQ